MVWNILRVGIFPGFINNKMSVFFESFAVFPADSGPSKFGEHSMVAFPRFYVDSAPNAFLCSPKSPNAFKQESSVSE